MTLSRIRCGVLQARVDQALVKNVVTVLAKQKQVSHVWSLSFPKLVKRCDFNLNCVSRDKECRLKNHTVVVSQETRVVHKITLYLPFSRYVHQCCVLHGLDARSIQD